MISHSANTPTIYYLIIIYLYLKDVEIEFHTIYYK